MSKLIRTPAQIFQDSKRLRMFGVAENTMTSQNQTYVGITVDLISKLSL